MLCHHKNSLRHYGAKMVPKRYINGIKLRHNGTILVPLGITWNGLNGNKSYQWRWRLEYCTIWKRKGGMILLADIITPLSYYTIPLLIPIILAEAFVCFLLVRKFQRAEKVSFWKILLSVATANVVSSFVGMLIPLYKDRMANLLWIGVALVLSILIEWAVLLIFLRRKLRPVDLLAISAVMNFVSYLYFAVMELLRPKPASIRDMYMQ
jgi:hypothetical protein